jgi:hypothetical protein
MRRSKGWRYSIGRALNIVRGPILHTGRVDRIVSDLISAPASSRGASNAFPLNGRLSPFPRVLGRSTRPQCTKDLGRYYGLHGNDGC